MLDPLPVPTFEGDPPWVRRLIKAQPEVVLMGPYMAYLLALALQERFPASWLAVPIAFRGLVGLWAVWLFRRHLPPLGRPHVLPALVCGVLSAGLWVGGQYLFNRLGLGGDLFKMVLAPFKGGWPAGPEVVDPTVGLTPLAWWSQAVLRIAVATTTVPLVEELFWRAFLLRALIDWNRFDRVPLGQFTWFSFLGTSLLSCLQHPAQWGVSVLCWFAFNGLFYWKKSILFLVIVHGVTNLALYLYVLAAGDWQFW